MSTPLFCVSSVSPRVFSAVFEMEFLDILDEIDEMDNEDQQLANPRARVYRLRTDFFHHFSDEEFPRHFRMSKETVMAILPRIERRLSTRSQRNNAIAPLNRFLFALHFYATGAFLRTSGEACGISKASASGIIRVVSGALCKLQSEEICMPTGARLRQTQSEFMRLYGFPRVVGAIDCTHVRIDSPGGNQPENARNRKGFFSINVQAVVNCSMEFLDLMAEWPGSSHDETLFLNSRVLAQFEDGEFGQGVLLGDSGYRLRTFLMTPFLRPANRAEELFNNAQKRARNVVERTFGVWKRRFPVLRQGLRLKRQTTQAVIIACGVLHNIITRRGDTYAEDDQVEHESGEEEEDTSEDEEEPRVPRRASMAAALRRDCSNDWCTSEALGKGYKYSKHA